MFGGFFPPDSLLNSVVVMISKASIYRSIDIDGLICSCCKNSWYTRIHVLKKWLLEWYLDHCKKLKAGRISHTSTSSLTLDSLHNVVVLAATGSSITLSSNDNNLNSPPLSLSLPLSPCFRLMDFSVDSTQPSNTLHTYGTHDISWLFIMVPSIIWHMTSRCFILKNLISISIWSLPMVIKLMWVWLVLLILHLFFLHHILYLPSLWNYVLHVS